MNSQAHDLNKFFNPRHIAVVGVSTGDFRFGGMSFLSKLQECGFPGKLYPINPKADEIRGRRAYPNLSALPEAPDLVIVCVAAQHTPSILEECGRLGLGHIHILTAGFRETGTDEGKGLEDRVLAISKDRDLLVIGPNCMGPYCPASGLTAWGAIPGLSGPLGVISQSGFITQRLTEQTCSLGLGVEKAVSFGNGTVLESTDFLGFMGRDDGIRVIAMYLESVRAARRFFSMAREVNRVKPIVLWKGGETMRGASTAASHTGSLSGERKIWEAFFRQTGVIRVRSMEEWADAALGLALLPAPDGKGVFLVGGGGGNSVTNSDICVLEGLDVPDLSRTTMDSLEKSVPKAGSIAGNPLDMFRVFQDTGYLGEVLELADNDPSISMIIVDRLIHRKAYHLPPMPDSTVETIELIKKMKLHKPVVFTIDTDGGDPWLAEKGAAMRAEFCKAGIPAYPSLKRAARALAHLYCYHSGK